MTLRPDVASQFGTPSSLCAEGVPVFGVAVGGSFTLPIVLAIPNGDVDHF